MSNFDYYQNPAIKSAIKNRLRYVRGDFDKEDCRQEIFAELYDYMPLDETEALKIVERVGRKFVRNIKKDYMFTSEYRDYQDWESLGDGNYKRRAHFSPAD